MERAINLEIMRSSISIVKNRPTKNNVLPRDTPIILNKSVEFKSLGSADETIKNSVANAVNYESDVSLEEPFEPSGSEYFPSDESGDEQLVYSKRKSKKSEYQGHPKEIIGNQKYNRYIKEKSENVEIEKEQGNIENVIEIPFSQKDINSGSRIRDKTHCCFYCHKQLKQLAKHFENQHSNELEVAKILAMPKNCKTRRDGFGLLLRVGDYYHNCEVLLKKQGELILVRRPNVDEMRLVNYSDYGPCPDCLGFMLKKHLWHHIKYGCRAKKQEEKSMRRNPMSESVALLAHTFGENLSVDFTSNILTKLKKDKITLVCQQDLLILKFGAMQYEKYHNTQCEVIRQSMRQLSRLVLELRHLDSNKKWLSEWLLPEHFDIVVAAVKRVSYFSENRVRRPKFDVPSLALKLGYNIKKCICINKGICLRKGDIAGYEKLNAFLSIMELEWNIKISSNALATLYDRKINAVELLPLTEDLIMLNRYLNNELIKAKSLLKYACEYKSWYYLATATLCKIILFNKRRSGEASKMTILQYSSRPNWSQSGTQEFKMTMTPLEAKLAENLTLVQIKGKRQRIVNVLLTSDVKECIDILIQTREKVNILTTNPYIFARSGGSIGNIRGHDCIRKFSQEANLIKPELISGTKLRKYIATVCQIFNLTENETDWLARHLGHDIRVHRDFYRLHESSVELTKVSRLLIAIENGEAHKFQGKTLSEINVCGKCGNVAF